ncbi:MAG: DUF5009 domain-containing protein [Kiritimatiellae bacterium]|nr:DUF5009 domain-containing protein [Kiritimatiellia bacterium]
MNTEKRLYSLDVLRGADMFFIMGGALLIRRLCIWVGASDCWLAKQMVHVNWIGFAQHDTIFPLFLFIAGVAWPFSYAAQREKGRSNGMIALRVLKRAALLVFLGLVYSGFFNFDFAHLRFPSVLARIGLGWAGAALLYIAVRKAWIRGVIAVLFSVGYWAILRFLIAPDAPVGADSFSLAGNYAGWIDRVVFGKNHLYTISDPEGLISTISGVVTAMLGVFAGEIVRLERFALWKRAVALAVSAVILCGLGFAWEPWCPCIKKLWTPTFALFAGAYSFAALALFYWLCDVQGWRKWGFFFQVIGLNSITIYMLQRIVNMESVSKFFFGGLANLLPDAAGKVVLSIGYILVCWLILLFLHRKCTYLKV